MMESGKKEDRGDVGIEFRLVIACLGVIACHTE